MKYPKVVIPKIDIADMVSKVKSRWDRRKNREFDLTGKEVTEEGEEKKSVDEHIEENRHREFYNPDTHEVSFANMRATDVKSNPKVMLPKPRSVKEEVELSTRSTLINKEVEEYIKSIEVNPSSLTKSERREDKG